MTVQEYMATQTERIAEALAFYLTTTPEDKLDWRPSLTEEVTTRSMLDQVKECVSVNQRFAAMLRGESATSFPEVSFANGQEAQEQLIASGKVLAEAIRGLSEEGMAQGYQHPRGEILGSSLIMMAYRNMAYHAGQINFIQTLYGDTEFRVPPNWR